MRKVNGGSAKGSTKTQPEVAPSRKASAGVAGAD
jgi:hypothetical protein